MQQEPTQSDIDEMLQTFAEFELERLRERRIAESSKDHNLKLRRKK